jgi:outer membrane protein OmpA-like peptidoglycan-associated protein
MSTACGACWTWAAIALVAATAPAFAQSEKLMSKNPSECEIYSTLTGDNSCSTEPSAGDQAIDDETQGLSIRNSNNGPDKGATSKPIHTAAKEPGEPAGSGPRAAAFQSIRFEFNSAELTPSARSTLDAVANVLREPTLATSKFVIVGHTDSTGTPDFNQLLSERRAQAVVHYLVQLGVRGDRLSARGMGESEPYDAAHPDAAVNRRVVVLNLGG